MQTTKHAQSDQNPPIPYLSGVSLDSSISALQSEVATLKDHINNMQQLYQQLQQSLQFYPANAPW